VPDQSRWTVIVPVKGFSAAKSRIDSASAAPADLARAFLKDVLAAIAQAPSVARLIVATADPAVAEVASEHGAEVVDDSGHPGINAAAAHASRQRAAGTGVAVVVSDLPGLTPSALGAALSLASLASTSFIADRAGTGTTMWMSGDGLGFPCHFGPQSRRAHVAAGALDLVAHHPEQRSALAAARADIDTWSELLEATRVGSFTAELLEANSVIHLGEDLRST